MKLQRYESLLDDEETGRGNSPLDDEEFVSGSTPMAGRRRTVRDS